MYASRVVDKAVLRVTHISPTLTTGRKDMASVSRGIWRNTIASTTTGWWVASRGRKDRRVTAMATVGRGNA
jgi:hypothetical protein